jgi:hypothetical protein
MEQKGAKSAKDEKSLGIFLFCDLRALLFKLSCVGFFIRAIRVIRGFSDAIARASLGVLAARPSNS